MFTKKPGSDTPVDVLEAIKKVAMQPVVEDVEQIDEISLGMKTRYMHAASANKDSHKMMQPSPEAAANAKKAFGPNDPVVKAHEAGARKIKNRTQGIARAAKLTENLLEGRLGNYAGSRRIGAYTGDKSAEEKLREKQKSADYLKTLSASIKKKPLKEGEENSDKRLVGTDELLDTYLKDTPGQENGAKKAPVNEDFLEEGFKVGEMVCATNPRAKPSYEVISKNATHYTLKHRYSSTPITLSKKRIHRVNLERKLSDGRIVEEPEQIDELSTGLKLRYKEKMMKNLTAHSDAWDRLAKKPSFNKKEQEQFDHHDKQAEKRYSGMRMVNKSLASVVKKVEARRSLKEDVEQIDEISPETRGSWINKTFQNHARHRADADNHQGWEIREPLKGPMPKSREKIFNAATKKQNEYHIQKNKDDTKAKLAARTPKVHDLRHMSHGEVYDHSQTSEHIHDGDILHVKGGHAMMVGAWPTMVHGKSDTLHTFKPGTTAHTIDGGMYHKTAKMIDKLRGK